MKFPVAYYLVFLYISTIFRPAVLIGCDMYSHAFEEAIHIATVHAMYGSNHLEKGIADSSSENGKNQAAPKAEDTAGVHLFTLNSYTIKTTTAQPIIYTGLLPEKIACITLSIQIPPPKHLS